MASSSSSFHDIFLSFRGEDTRDGFTSHLYAALSRKNIETFKDDNKLEKGEEISPALLKAIEDSKLSVIIFSKDYASSKWCLDELVKIIECKNTSGQIVVPVFYGVKPSDVRKQSGSFEVAFAKHEKDFKEKNMEKVQRWRVAVTEAANLSGWEWEATKPESTLVDEIVTFVLKKLKHMSSSEFKGLVGLDSCIERFNSFVRIGSLDVLMLGMWGIGGIGKTTIVGAFFNRYSSQFEACCFIPNVRERSEKRGLDHLREELLFKTLGDKNLHIGTPHIGSTFIKDWLNHKKLLIVFDDVTTLSQLETLVGGPDIRVGSLRSRIIITSRDRQVLKNCGVDYIQEVEGLKKDEALQLFCQYAFKQNRPTKYQLELSEKVVSYAKGNQLALKVLGSSLFDKSDREWKSKLGALKGTIDKEIEQVLKISYDRLEVDKKDIFLYIACFFKGRSRDYATQILDGCGFSAEDGISVLIDKALITCDEYNILSMHDLLQDLGQHIVCEESNTEPGKRRMLWNHEDIYHVLKETTGTETVEGISLDMSKIRDVHLRPEAFARMCNLKLLKFFDWHIMYDKGKSKVHLSQGLESLPNQLRFLCWQGYPFKTLPSKFHPEKLVELDMPYSRIEKLWTGVQPLLVNLKMINLSYSRYLKEMPDLSQTPNLETIDLKGCDKIRSPTSSSHLKTLQDLSLQDLFESLSQLSHLGLPTSICKLKLLDNLNLSGCSKLENFPEILELMDGLRYLSLNRTAIKEIPSSVEHLINIDTFDLTGCENLVSLPNNICNLKSLRYLYLSNCSNLTELPENLGNLKLLALMLKGCKRLQSLPELPSSLSQLDASNCTSLETVSSNEVDMECHGFLIFNNCNKLDQDARNKIVAAAQLRFQNTKRFYFCYPGSEFPKWFSHQCVGSSLTISSDNKFVRSMVVGANIGFDHEHDNPRLPFRLKFYIKRNDGCGRSPATELLILEYFGSDNLRLLFPFGCSIEVNDVHVGRSTHFEHEYVGSDNMILVYIENLCGNNITEVSLEIFPSEIFSSDVDDKHEKTLRKLKVKKLGVALSYDDNHYSTEKVEEEEEEQEEEEDDDDDYYSSEEEEEQEEKKKMMMTTTPVKRKRKLEEPQPEGSKLKVKK